MSAPAQTVFLDDQAIRFYDSDHFDDEDRFLMLSMRDCDTQEKLILKWAP